MYDAEIGSLKPLKLNYRRGDQISQTFCGIVSPPPTPESSSPLFNLQKFQDSHKSTRESCRMHSNLMNDEEFWSIKLLKMKYRREDQIIKPFCRIVCPQKLGPQSLICRNFKTLRKKLLNHGECIEIL